MKIYLMRHGEASFNTSNDNLRELTEGGYDRVELNIMQKLEELSQVEGFFSSPLLRAKQTAELARYLLDRKDPIIEVNWLIHESDPSQAIIQLCQLKLHSILLFSHQPFASRFVEKLCDLAEGEIYMNTASIIAIEVDPVVAGFGSVLWQLP